MVNTNNKPLNDFLDAVLKGKDRELLLVGAEDKKAPCALITFNESHIRFLEGQIQSMKAQMDNLSLALAISCIGLSLGVSRIDEEE